VYGTAGNCASGYYWNGTTCIYTGGTGNCGSGYYWNGYQCVYGNASGTNCQWNGNGYYNIYNFQSYPTQPACYNASGGTGVNCAQSGNYFYNIHNYQWYNTYNDCIAAG
jgi:hypothetical protein